MGKYCTLDDLYNFCCTNNFTKFCAKENNNMPLIVHQQGTFSSNEERNDSLLPVSLVLAHDEINLNKSKITYECYEDALVTCQNKPILANIHKVTYDDGTEQYEFSGHDMTVDPDNDEKTYYIEQPIGILPESCNAHLEYNKEDDRNYLVANGYIFKEYGNQAADIIKREGAVDVSIEIAVHDMNFDAKEKVLTINKMEFLGVTCLGKTETGEKINPAMTNANLTIQSFNAEDNYSTKLTHSKLIEMLDKLNSTLSSFNKEKSEEGGTQVNKLQELMKQYEVTEEQITFETEGLSDEELEAKFAEVFGEEDTTASKDEDDINSTEDETSDDNTSDGEEASDGDGVTEEYSLKHTITNSDGVTKEFELSLSDIQYALYSLVNDAYSEADNAWYSVATYETYVIMQDWYTDKAYKQSYKREGDNFSLTGDRVEVYANWLTKDEESALAELRSNYSVIEAELNTYKEAELNAQKEAVLADEAYAEFADTEEFKALADEASKYSVEELRDKCDLAFAKLVKAQGTFSAKPNATSNTKPNTVIFSTQTEETKTNKPYGDLFD